MIWHKSRQDIFWSNARIPFFICMPVMRESYQKLRPFCAISAESSGLGWMIFIYGAIVREFYMLQNFIIARIFPCGLIWNPTICIFYRNSVISLRSMRDKYLLLLCMRDRQWIALRSFFLYNEETGKAWNARKGTSCRRTFLILKKGLGLLKKRFDVFIKRFRRFKEKNSTFFFKDGISIIVWITTHH